MTPALLDKLSTGIDGLDLILDGGLPKGRSTLVSGTAGSAKTVMASQFLAAGISQFAEPGVFVTFEETPHDIRSNMQGFGWDIKGWESSSLWAFVDASPLLGDEPVEVGNYDFSALIARVTYAVKRTNAKRVVIDSLAGIFNQFVDASLVRREMFRLLASLKASEVTSLVTSERMEEGGPLARFGVEEFVADNVIILRNSMELEKRRRTIEILKLRGTSHQKGQFPFTVTADEGIIVLPLSAIELKQRSSNVRIASGNNDLDKMCGGGFFRDSIILASGPTGTGKTLITTHFIMGGVDAGERCLLLAFEESRDQLFRNATGWGMDYEAMEAKGLLRVICVYPESKTLEDHLITIKKQIMDFKPRRLAVDSLTALERVSTEKTFREFVVALTSFVKQYEVAGLFTATTASLLGGSSVTESHISTITDLILLLRYVEVYGEMRRGLTVLKMRGSMHDKEIREVKIDGTGLHLGKAFRTVSGILSGRYSQLTLPTGESEQWINSLFRDEGSSRDSGNSSTG